MMNHIMVDLETTGTDSGRHAMIQLAAYRFDLEKGQIDPQPFNRCLTIPNWRTWSESTRAWWTKDKTMREILQGIMSRAEDPKPVLQDFVQWVCKSESPVFWSKPTHFDWGFLESYFNDFGLMNPFHYRRANDMNTFLRGLHFPNEVPNLGVEMRGNAHDAVFDVLHQIETVWAHLEEARS